MMISPFNLTRSVWNDDQAKMGAQRKMLEYNMGGCQ